MLVNAVSDEHKEFMMREFLRKLRKPGTGASHGIIKRNYKSVNEQTKFHGKV